MFLLIVLLFAFTIFAFVVTNKGAGEALSHRGYKEYRLGDYSNWLQNKVTNGNTWERIRGCLESGKLCSEYHFKFLNDNIEKFHTEQLSALQVRVFCFWLLDLCSCVCCFLGWGLNFSFHI